MDQADGQGKTSLQSVPGESPCFQEDFPPCFQPTHVLLINLFAYII